ncbi:long-chain-fatty-acid--CoA ligase [Desulfovirgula thermocuniculi]|uniref:long-chain-fatty-acid--CoA ligase n=1 Tax=Desulfovirgula thermocuniculi TaxID=348842 RepID=UPI0003F68898|nr:long-chain-fatty-acid--CoA ligase [Desulfovirgula thermocuniculi]
MHPTIGTVFENVACRYPKREALVCLKTGRRWTYGDWFQEVKRMSSALYNLGLRKGDVLSVCLFNNADFTTLYFAAARLGIVFNPINYRLTSAEAAYILNDCEAKAIVFEKATTGLIEGARPQLKTVKNFLYTDSDPPPYAIYLHELTSKGLPNEDINAIEVGENEPYAILYTSGTTGRPKGVVHCHRAILDHCYLIMHAAGLTYNDIGLSAAPLYHAAELHGGFLPRVMAGAKNVLLPLFKPSDVLAAVQAEKVTLFFGAPTMWYMLLQEDLSLYDLSSLRLGLYGASSMSAEMVSRIRQAFNIELLQAYGMTEFGPCVTFLLPYEQISKAGSAGKPILNHEIRVVRYSENPPSDPDDVLQPGEVGEILVRGTGRMLYYHKLDDETKRKFYKGWYHTSDMGYIDVNGYLWWVDRADDIIISGGVNISSREVEDALMRHPGVLEVAVVGLPDEKWGQIVTAFVVLKEGTTAEDLESFLTREECLAHYKRPKSYVVVEALPKTPTGKVKKYELRWLGKQK